MNVDIKRVFMGRAAAQESEQQESGGITPFTPPTCSQGVEWWGSLQVLWEGDDPLLIANTAYTAREVKQFLILGGSAGRDHLPLVVQLAQELVAYKLNLKGGFPATPESEIVAAEFEAQLLQLVGGLPGVDTTAFDEDGVGDPLPYY